MLAKTLSLPHKGPSVCLPGPLPGHDILAEDLLQVALIVRGSDWISWDRGQLAAMRPPLQSRGGHHLKVCNGLHEGASWKASWLLLRIQWDCLSVGKKIRDRGWNEDGAKSFWLPR